MYLARFLCTSQVLGNTEHDHNRACLPGREWHYTHRNVSGTFSKHLSGTTVTLNTTLTECVYLVRNGIEGKQLLSPGTFSKHLSGTR